LKIKVRGWIAFSATRWERNRGSAAYRYPSVRAGRAVCGEADPPAFSGHWDPNLHHAALRHPPRTKNHAFVFTGLSMISSDDSRDWALAR